MAKHWAEGTTERTIHFYRIHAGSGSSGEAPFPTAAVLKHVENLDYTERFLPAQADNQPGLYCWVDKAGPSGHLKFANVRREGFPQVEQAGALSDLEIPDGSGLVEVVHVGFFSGNVIGAAFNFYGPRPSRLAPYLQRMAPGICPPCRVTPLLRGDVADRLDRMDDIKVLDLRVYAPYIATIRRASSTLANALDQLHSVGQAQEVELVLRPKRYSRTERLAHGVLTIVRRLVRQPELREAVSKLTVRGTVDGVLEEIDVLADALLLKERIALEHKGTRALNDDSAYGAIREAHRKLRAELAAASSVAG
jgi:hypothetical protein